MPKIILKGEDIAVSIDVNLDFNLVLNFFTIPLEY